MRTSIVSFGLGSTTGSSVGAVEVDGQKLFQKVQELHNFVEQSFRQQGKLLRELRRARRKGAFNSFDRLDSWDPPSPEPPSVPEEEEEELDRSMEAAANETEGNQREPHMAGQAKARPPLESTLARVPQTSERSEGSKEGEASEGNGHPTARPSIESILIRTPQSPEEGSAGQNVRNSLGSNASHGQRRFALRLSQDSQHSAHTIRSKGSNRSSSHHSGSRSWATDYSSPDSFVQDELRKHFTAAQVQATWQQRRRAASLDTLEIEESIVTRYAKAVVRSKTFLGLLTLLIFLHVVLMGIEVDLAASTGAPLPDWFDIFNLVLVSFFVVELCLKFAAFGCAPFWFGADWAWNSFDFLVIALSVLDVVLEFSLRASVSTGQVRVFRVLRIFRYVRSIRVVRLFRYISALQVLTLSILGTMSSLAWTLVLLMLIIYSFGVVLTEIVLQHCGELSNCDEELTKHWANLRQSMLSLFMAISQGLNWQDLLTPLLNVSEVGAILLILYVIMTIFAILNVVTGVFCNTAIESAGADKDIRTLKQIQDKAQQVELLKSVFDEIDFEQVNEISFDDVKRCLANGDLSSFMESMGISTNDVWTLFMLLDSDMTGLLDIDEFVNGCMQLRGPAKSLQVAKMSYENKLTRSAIRDVGKELASVRARLEQIRHKMKRHHEAENPENVSVAL